MGAAGFQEPTGSGHWFATRRRCRQGASGDVSGHHNVGAVPAAPVGRLRMP